MQFSEIESYWYDKIKEADPTWTDIESCDHESLKEWHSFHFVSHGTQLRILRRTPYQTQIDSFANNPAFGEIVSLMVMHGNSRFTEDGVTEIWTLHRNGWSDRKIAGEMLCSKSCITFLLKRMREWMKLIS